ncbi:hypothetical protein Landi51_02287 [Colletotrichum acutatum]
MGSWEPAWPRSSRAGEQLDREDSIAARQIAHTVSPIHPISSWTVERRAAPRRLRETLNKIPAAAAWFMLDGGGRICASKPHASRPIARPFAHESYVILFRTAEAKAVTNGYGSTADGPGSLADTSRHPEADTTERRAYQAACCKGCTLLDTARWGRGSGGSNCVPAYGRLLREREPGVLGG